MTALTLRGTIFYGSLLIIGLHYSTCIKITRLEVDSPIISGEGGWLRCEWDEEGDEIYAVKWYFGLHEFYRYIPKNKHPLTTFALPQFSVDKGKSKKGHVFIKDVSLKSSGFLRCEVSGEAPAFHTGSAITKLTVVDLPDTRPLIKGVLPIYQLHEKVSLTCSSPRSKPAASLAFYVNGEPADPMWVFPRETRTDPETTLETAVLHIRFPLRPRLLQEGKVLVKCAATLKDLYWESNEAELTVNAPLRASRLEERSSPTSSAGSCNVLSLLNFQKSIWIPILVFWLQVD